MDSLEMASCAAINAIANMLAEQLEYNGVLEEYTDNQLNGDYVLTRMTEEFLCLDNVKDIANLLRIKVAKRKQG